MYRKTFVGMFIAATAAGSLIGGDAAWAGPVSTVQGSAAHIAADRVCRSGEFCVYKDRDFSTSNSMYRFTLSYSNWCGPSNAPEVCEDDSSWNNKRSVTTAVYDWSGYSNVNLCVGANRSVGYSSANNDDGASHHLDKPNCQV